MTNIVLKQSNNIGDNITFSDDLFNRKTFGESLSNLIINSGNESLVISVNANWGEGKSYFLKMWKNFLLSEKSSEENPLNVIYFDSFKNDYIEDPFIPLLGEVISYFSSDSSIKDKGINIIKGILPLLGKVGARWIMKGDSEQVDNDIEKLLEGDIVSQVGKTLEDYVKKDTTIKDFKNTLEHIIEEKGQLIFIIDELDRCRPDFALRLLERIKHFFDIKGLYFVLGINKEQIVKYVNKIYGDINGDEYLQKFIDVETILPKNFQESGNDYEKYINKMLDEDYLTVFSNFSERKNSIKKLLIHLSLHTKISFRELEKILNHLVLFYKSIPPTYMNMHSLVIILIFVRIKNIKLYEKICRGKSIKTEIIELLDLYNNDFSLNENVLNELGFVFDENISDDLHRKYQSLGIHEYYERKEFLLYHLNILDSFNI